MGSWAGSQDEFVVEQLLDVAGLECHDAKETGYFHQHEVKVPVLVLK